MDVKLIRAFIASPGGLDLERRAAVAAAAEVNRSVAQPLGARLELLGWEETLSGSGRPQAIINAEMETCDLFIGLMWTKWGSLPSLGGPYSSGFEEEFELSRERYGRTQTPLMAMFFKTVDDRQLDDPGDELKKVLAFQEKLRAEKSFLYDTFADVEAFAAKVRIFLAIHVIRLLNQTNQNDEPRRSRTVSGSAGSPESASEAKGTDDQSEVSREEAAFLQRAAVALNNENGPTAADVARLRLIAASSKTDGNDPLIVGPHDANILYESRAALRLSQWEKRGLLVAGLAALPHQNVPIWTWLGELDRKQPALLLLLTLHGEDAERAGALNVLRLLRRPIAEQDIIDPSKVLRSWFAEDRGDAVKLAALHYLRDVGTELDLAAVDSEAARADKDTGDTALAASLSILSRLDTRAALTRLLHSSFETLPGTIVRSVLEHADDLSTQELLPGLDHRSPDVRAITVRILGGRLALSIETLKRASEDDSAIVRLAAVEAFDKVGQPLSLDEASEVLGRSRKPISYLLGSRSRDGMGEALFESYREQRLSTMTIAPLRALLSSSEHSHAAYRALAARNVDDFANTLRADIREGFESYFSRYWPEGIKPPPSTVLSGLGVGANDPNETKRRELLRAAVDTICARRDDADLGLIRETLDAYKMSPSEQTIGFLAALGSVSDIPRLAQTPRFSWPSMISGDLEGEFKQAAKTILTFSKGRLGELLSSDIPNPMRAQILQFAPWAELGGLADEEIVLLLLSEDDSVKRSAARRFAGALPRRRIGKILRLYRTSPGGIYYIITHWLDLGLGLSQRMARAVVGGSE